jgi:hypothetical protein
MFNNRLLLMIIEEARPLGLSGVKFTGGEPAALNARRYQLRPQLPRVYNNEEGKLAWSFPSGAGIRLVRRYC